MVLVISIIGSLICIFAIPYMKKHEEHLHLKKMCGIVWACTAPLDQAEEMFNDLKK